MKTPAIGLVDDDAGMLRGLDRLLAGRGFIVRQFSSAEDFLMDYREARLDCLVLDVMMPGLGGLDLLDHLRRRGVLLPVIFLSGEGDVPRTVRAMKAGAVNFLTKPVNVKELLNAVRVALIEGTKARVAEEKIADLRVVFDRLTSREMEVFRHVIVGKLNKQIADDLGISEQTVKLHRMKITEKTGLTSVADLVRAAGSLQIEVAD